jgi:transposase
MECVSTSEAMLLALLKNRKGKKKKKSGGVQKKITKRVHRRVEVRTLAKSTTLTGAQIARRTGMPKSFVYDQINKLRRKVSVNDLPRTGRPKKVTKTVTKKILAKTKGKEKRSTRKVAKILQGEGIQISHETVWRTLRSQGLIPHRKVPRPKLTHEQQTRRLEFARAFLSHDWAHTLFTDEKHFTTFSPPNRRNDIVWDERGVGYAFQKVKHPPQIRFWGGISYFGKTTLVEYEGTINSDAYIEIIRGQVPTIYKIFGRDPFWFQQDGASAHTSAKTTNFLRQTFVHFLGKGEWPAQSPDLNVIENLWAIINDKVWARDPKGVEEMRVIIIEEWNALGCDLLQRLVNSMTARLQQCIEREGLWTDF